MTTAELLADVAQRGITLQADGGKLRFYPRDAVGPELLELLARHKVELLAILTGDSGDSDETQNEPATAGVVSPSIAESKPAWRCRCGSTTWRDFPIHNGLSTRRDCARCRRFLAFPVWYGQPSLN